jgi:hypothetical protein
VDRPEREHQRGYDLVEVLLGQAAVRDLLLIGMLQLGVMVVSVSESLYVTDR